MRENCLVHGTVNGERCMRGCNWGAATEARGVISIYHYIHLFKKGAKEFFSLGKVKSMSHAHANHGERCMLGLCTVGPPILPIHGATRKCGKHVRAFVICLPFSALEDEN